MQSHGWSEDDAAALVFNGTLPAQETIQATLGELAAMSKQPKFRDPAMLVVGRVAGLREHLRWFDARPLFGKRIVVTRPREQAAELVDALEQLGATVVEAPTVRIVPPEDFAPLDEACASVGQFDWVVFTSVNGVDYFFQRLQAGPTDVARAGRRAAVRDRPGHRGAAGAARPQGGPHAGGVPGRGGGRGAARDRRPVRPARSCCRAPTSRASCSPTNCASRAASSPR